MKNVKIILFYKTIFDKINWFNFTYNKNGLILKNKYIDKLSSFYDTDIVFEIYQEKYDNLKKGYTKIIYNM